MAKAAEQKQKSTVVTEEKKLDIRDVVHTATTYGRRRNDVAMVALRAMCMAVSAVAVTLTVTARETSMTTLYGFEFQLHAVWSLSDSLIYLVVVSSATVLYSLLQLITSGTRLMTLNKGGMMINGVVIVGVKPVDPIQKQALNERLNNQGFTPLPPPLSTRDTARPSSRLQYLQNGSAFSPQTSGGAMASPSRSMVAKVYDLMFGV
ncbi:PREDICTED: CASP-like protein 3A1 [Camelina sativa]|uniref:CASP-like protein n=1 Tax=Camelina sativa TaxID=90675 RepID=A0ABM0T169_CAMSA|nr:PREDICTED: CASP-like protein 3A1 [Camelina sativa]